MYEIPDVVGTRQSWQLIHTIQLLYIVTEDIDMRLSTSRTGSVCPSSPISERGRNM